MNFITFRPNKKVFMNAACLSASPRFNSRRGLEHGAIYIFTHLIYVNYAYRGMFDIVYEVCSINSLFTGPSKEFCYIILNEETFFTLSNKVEKCLWMQLVCPPVHAVARVDRFRFPRIWYFLMRLIVAFSILYTKSVASIVYLQGTQKNSVTS